VSGKASGPAIKSSDQSEVVAFLGDPRSYRPAPDRVDRIDTHGAMVFLAGDSAYKIKRAVRYAYMDFSTLELRRAACENEIRVNRANAPQIYLGAVPITREGDGKLAIDGKGAAVEWAVHMRRFDEAAGLDRLAEKGELDRPLLELLARRIAEAHERAPRRERFDQPASFARIIANDREEFAAAPDLFDPAGASILLGASEQAAGALAPLLSARSGQGFVRLCHGDLHLRNIVLIDNEPVLFDAIEFDDAIATVDVIYDLAFLLMDLDQRGLREGANLVFNGYLKSAREDAHLDALGALPLFLSSRAAIRARVAAARSRHVAAAAKVRAIDQAKHYFAAACGYLAPAPPRLVAVGGLSGSGKTTLARRLAPLVGAAPGAVHLRSDVERKALFKVAETKRLKAEGYSPEVTARVYRRLAELAARALAAGHSVVVDAVYSTPQERSAIEEVAAGAGVPFTGFWLDAPEQVLIARVEGRRGDASDADADVVRGQLARGTGSIGWIRAGSGGKGPEVLERTRTALGIPPRDPAPG